MQERVVSGPSCVFGGTKELNYLSYQQLETQGVQLSFWERSHINPMQVWEESCLRQQNPAQQGLYVVHIASPVQSRVRLMFDLGPKLPSSVHSAFSVPILSPFLA